MKYEIKHEIYLNEKNEIKRLDVWFDQFRFELDKGDVWALKQICETVFDRMIEPISMVSPKINRKVVIGKRKN